MIEGKDLKHLGSEKTNYYYNEPNVNILETFDNKYPHRDYKIKFIFPEFTSLCPKTAQPDFATIEITYIADKKCIETKSLKLYLFAYRQFGSFMESITNKLLEDFVNVCNPRWMEVIGKFNARGGISINVKAEYSREN